MTIQGKLKPGRKETHGLYHHRLYKIRNQIQQRCCNKNRKDYYNYGGRGISCERGSVSEFIKDMDLSFIDGMSIERIDVNGNYSKHNCCWVPRKQQARNRKNTRWVDYKGQKICLGEIAEIESKDYKSLRYQYNKTLDITLSLKKAKGIKGSSPSESQQVENQAEQSNTTQIINELSE